MTRSGNAGVLSPIFPGLGQFYNGHFWRRGFWLVITPFMDRLGWFFGLDLPCHCRDSGVHGSGLPVQIYELI